MPHVPAIVRGKIRLPEISGAALIADDHLLLVSDEKGIFVIDNARERLLEGEVPAVDRLKVEPRNAAGAVVKFNDLEDVTWDPQERRAYLVGSHSRSRKAGKGEDRRLLLRLQFDTRGKHDPDAARASDGLQKVLGGQGKEVGLFKEAQNRTAAQCGLNIEGLEWAGGGALWVGLRSPALTFTEDRPGKFQEDAILLRIPDVDALFDDPSAARLEPPPVPLGPYHRIDEAAPAWPINLHGHGIRGLSRDDDGSSMWILSGLPVDPNFDLQSPPWEVWRRTAGGELQSIRLPRRDLGFPEAICRLTLDGVSYLLLVEDTEETSDYLLLPTALL